MSPWSKQGASRASFPGSAGVFRGAPPDEQSHINGKGEDPFASSQETQGGRSDTLQRRTGKSRKQTRLSLPMFKPIEGLLPVALKVQNTRPSLSDFFARQLSPVGNHQQTETQATARSERTSIGQFNAIWSGFIPLPDKPLEERVLLKTFTNTLISELCLKNHPAACKN